MFDCGIHEISNQIMQQEENTVIRVVQEAGYHINKEQLTKALTDSKSFYNQGYEDGYDKAFTEMIQFLRTHYVGFNRGYKKENLRR